MSNSELILVKDGANRIEFDIVKRQPSEFQKECCEARATRNCSNDVPNDGGERQVLEDDEEKKGEESDVKAAVPDESETKYIDDEEDDGFKTPTSLDYKIPEMKQCPPAPRKPKANKRRASPSSSGTANTSTHGNLQLDLSQVVESWFPVSLVDDLHRKVKKARTHEN
ncbi:hypothetical protein V6N12_035840 [Hibiscus sabdariffa]|uniref:Uncharacterized protein n=1 Tax=Hibiscus sabdariffa TaxID=183260 RepID=A0ABR2ENX0_9ROSI